MYCKSNDLTNGFKSGIKVKNKNLCVFILISAATIAKPVTPQQKLCLQGQHARLSLAATQKAMQSACESETIKTKGAASALVEVRTWSKIPQKME